MTQTQSLLCESSLELKLVPLTCGGSHRERERIREKREAIAAAYGQQVRQKQVAEEANRVAYTQKQAEQQAIVAAQLKRAADVAEEREMQACHQLCPHLSIDLGHRTSYV